MVSLREGKLKLLALRGKLQVGSQTLSEVELAPAMQVILSPDTRLQVIEVWIPPRVMCIRHSTLGSHVLGATVSFRREPRLELVHGALRDADAIFWTDGERWFVTRRYGDEVPLEVGATLDIQGERFFVEENRVVEAGQVTLDNGRAEPLLHLRVRYETVHIDHREGDLPVVLDGQVARIVSDLATAGVPVPWQVIAQELWQGEKDVVVLRRNWDAALARLRRKLREGGVRADLVRADRNGNFELYLRRGDKIEDQT